ncbi:MAG TPA: hypothetical protein VMA74_20740, partial [Dyella sp.]|uniref:hypothetical protein n=1 Tax=Dyella sp. TaxID=1869338 RepID=UPI002B8801BA
MTAPYFGTWWLIAPPNVDPSVVARARKVVGELKEREALTGAHVLKRAVSLNDGTVITASTNHGNVVVTIQSPTQTAEVPDNIANMWVPRGFVLYPAWQANPLGVGLPIILDSSVGPYDPANMAPGLDTSRWTPGGTLGEVLLSPDEDAGYQPATVVPTPLLYDVTAAPQFQWSLQGENYYDGQQPDSNWAPYRLELSPFSNVGNGANPGEQQAVFEGINVLRANAGVDAAIVRLRGFARGAEITSTLLLKNGSASPTGAGFPTSYATPAERLTMEGYAADWTQENFPSFDRQDIAVGVEFLAAGSSSTALARWKADPTLGPAMVLASNAMFVDVGSAGAFTTAQMFSRDRWIAAGNMSWQSSDTSLPPLSWHGFASLNLAWETFPCLYATGMPSAPLTIAVNFTDADGDCWLAYPRSKTPTAQTAEIAMGRHIYCRGRAIAMAPEGALVWGACVLPNAVANKDRLILLAHHPIDQPSDTQHQGFTRYLRVWWCDIPQRSLRLDPPMVIVGTDSTDPYAWSGGTLIDLGIMPASATGKFTASGTPNSLKYASQWRFSQDGTRAVCLRDYAGYADYAYLTSYGSANGMGPRAVELVFSADGQGTGVQTVFHDFVAGMANYLPSEGAEGSPITVAPAAVDYQTGTLNLIYLYTGHKVEDSVSTTYVGSGNASVPDVEGLSYGIAIGTDDFRVDDFSVFVVGCADVNNAAFVASGVHVYSVFDPGTEQVIVNPNYVCWPFTESAAFGVRQFMQGKKVSETWYAVPNGALVTGSPPCALLNGPITLSLANSFCV